MSINQWNCEGNPRKIEIFYLQKPKMRHACIKRGRPIMEVLLQSQQKYVLCLHLAAGRYRLYTEYRKGVSLLSTAIQVLGNGIPGKGC